MGDIVTTNQVAECVEGLDSRSAAALIRSNILPGQRIGYRFATTRRELLDFIRAHPKITLTKAGASLVDDSE